MAKKEGDFLFECSWEVCNKVGGIHTVIVSKILRIIEVYGKDYCAIGPYFPSGLPGQFIEEMAPDSMKSAFESLKAQGIVPHFGRWLIAGQPKALLLDTSHFWHRLNDIKKELWEQGQVDSLNSPKDFDEPMLWSYASGIAMHEISKAMPGKKIVAHCHEWLAGAGLIYLKSHAPTIATVFTTHATTLGRSISNSNEQLYENLASFDPKKAAESHHVQAKHSLERASAQLAHAFTTVSEITGMEAEHFLGRKPDVLLPNGLDISKFPVFEEILIKHRTQRDRIREFCISYFFPYYQFDIEDTLIFFLASRYEFRAKGIDLSIKALAELNKRLKEEGSKKTIIMFFWVPGNVRNIKPEVIENKTLFNDVRDSFLEMRHTIQQKALYLLLEHEQIKAETLFGDEFLAELSQKLARMKRKGLPPLSTHDLHDYNDSILHSLYEAGLTNKEEDRVKVIFYPTYLNGADSLIDLNYYEAMQASHMGIFPSYYEPWGYTPLEAGALGVPAVTTDMSGFGRYFCQDCFQGTLPGIYIIKRLGKSDNEALSQLTDVLYKFSMLSREERTKNKLEARQVAAMVDWSNLIDDYVKAHNFALEKAHR